MPPVRPTAGWYADPSGLAPLRWWDGAAWSAWVHQAMGAVPGRRELADWWSRARGYLLDAGPLWLASLFLLDRWHGPFLNEVAGIIRVSVLTDGGRWPSLELIWSYGLVQMWLLTAIPGALMRVAYDVACHLWRGATFGQRSVGVRVVAENPGAGESGAGLAWHRALRRSVVLRFLAPTAIGWLVCVLWPLVDGHRRSLADLAAGTIVVRDERARNVGQLGALGR